MSAVPANCGGTPTVSTQPSIWSTILALVGGAAAVGGVIASIVKLVPLVAAAIIKLVGIFGTTLSSAGGAAVFGIAAAAAATATLIILWAWNSLGALCGTPPVGKLACVSGVINSVTAGFSDWYSEIVAFAGNQPGIDVVVKSVFWPTVVTTNNPPMVWCAPCSNCPASVVPPAIAAAGGGPGCSPMLICFYHNSQVCSAATGAAVGATVGAALGAIGGTIAGIAAMGALGCSLGGPFAPICWLILAIVILLVVAVVVAVALIGSAIGSQSGKAAAGGSSGPPQASGVSLTVGTFVSVVGNLVVAQAALSANALWFTGWIPNANGQTVDDETATNNNGTTTYGMSSGTAPFCFTDPDDPVHGIPASEDVCLTQ
jgi:hypothetical protein